MQPIVRKEPRTHSSALLHDLAKIDRVDWPAKNHWAALQCMLLLATNIYHGFHMSGRRPQQALAAGPAATHASLQGNVGLDGCVYVRCYPGHAAKMVSSPHITTTSGVCICVCVSGEGGGCWSIVLYRLLPLMLAAAAVQRGVPTSPAHAALIFSTPVCTCHNSQPVGPRWHGTPAWML